jgi:hypothetical protein
MRKFNNTLLWLLSLTIAFSSCQKEASYATNNNGTDNTGNSGNTNDIKGDYDFVGMQAHTQSTVTVNESGQELKTITVTDYLTHDNVGTVTITSNQMNATGIGYSIDTVLNVKTYVDNTLIDDEDLPFSAAIPPASSNSSYVRNSADSITVTGPLGFPDASGNIPTGDTGAKLAWSGDTLLIKISTGYSQTISQGGATGIITGSIEGIMKLKKH